MLNISCPLESNAIFAVTKLFPCNISPGLILKMDFILPSFIFNNVYLSKHAPSDGFDGAPGMENDVLTFITSVIKAIIIASGMDMDIKIAVIEIATGQVKGIIHIAITNAANTIKIIIIN